MLASPQFNIAHFLAAFAASEESKGIRVEFHPFTYGLDFLDMATASPLTQELKIEGDSDFILTQTSSDRQADDVLVEMFLGSSGRELQNTPVQLDNIFGTGSEPFYWYYPLFLERRSSLIVKLTGANDKRLAFHGVKVFSTRIAHRAGPRGQRRRRRA